MVNLRRRQGTKGSVLGRVLQPEKFKGSTIAPLIFVLVAGAGFEPATSKRFEFCLKMGLNNYG